MSGFSLHQWVLFFYFYCLCGWVWESCYVSAKKHHWVNRGFLHGPLLPIYGSGAIIVLLATLPVQDNLWNIFFMGMLAATVLEYITGSLMEWMFHVRYWDYSNQKLNINGYICLSSSLAWGVFSIAMVRLVHPPIAQLFSLIPNLISEVLAFLITIVFTIDSVISFNEAMNLRELLTTITENNENLRRIKSRMDVYAAFAGEGINELKEKADSAKQILQESSELKKLSRKQLMEQRIETQKESKLEILQSLTDTLGNYQENFRQALDDSRFNRENFTVEISEALTGLAKQMKRIAGSSNKNYKHAINLLKRNPGAKSEKYVDALEDIKKLEK